MLQKFIESNHQSSLILPIQLIVIQFQCYHKPLVIKVVLTPELNPMQDEGTLIEQSCTLIE